MTVDWSMIAQVLLTALLSTLFMGVLAFRWQRSFEQRLNESLEEFKADLQLRTFERRSWWELKREAYAEIIESLVELQYCLDRRLRDLCGIENLGNGLRTKLEQAYLHALESLTKAAATVAFIVSEDTIATLERLLDGLDREVESWFDTMDIHHKFVRDATVEVGAQAMAELRKR